MNNKKENMIGVRFSNDERAHLEKIAEAHCMSLSQYMRYKILQVDAEALDNSEQSSPKHWRLLSSVIIYSYLHIRFLAKKQLSEDELDEIKSQAEQRFQELGL